MVFWVLDVSLCFCLRGQEGKTEPGPATGPQTWLSHLLWKSTWCLSEHVGHVEDASLNYFIFSFCILQHVHRTGRSSFCCPYVTRIWCSMMVWAAQTRLWKPELFRSNLPLPFIIMIFLQLGRSDVSTTTSELTSLLCERSVLLTESRQRQQLPTVEVGRWNYPLEKVSRPKKQLREAAAQRTNTAAFRKINECPPVQTGNPAFVVFS